MGKSENPFSGMNSTWGEHTFDTNQVAKMMLYLIFTVAMVLFESIVVL